MASDGNPGTILITSLVQGTQQASGKSVPIGGKNAAQATAASGESVSHSITQPARTTDPQSLVDLLNKFLNDSGRPDQFRVDPASSNKLIQEINPATGAVIGEFSVDEFPALARSVGATSLLIDSRV
jgi:hypothetical protein